MVMTGKRRPVALTIAGTDSSGGAGATADLKVFEALAVWGTVAVTAVTAQDSLGVSAVLLVPPEVIAAQIRERRDLKAHTRATVLVERVRGHFHRHRQRAGIAQLRELPVQAHRVGRGERTRNNPVGKPDA